MSPPTAAVFFVFAGESFCVINRQSKWGKTGSMSPPTVAVFFVFALEVISAGVIVIKTGFV